MGKQKSKLNVAEALKFSDEVSVLTKGASMRPMLREHQDIVVIKKNVMPLRVGDVVLYSIGNNVPLVLHRIIKINAESFTMRGDNNYFTEYGIKKENIVGILYCFYRNGKYIDCETSYKYKIYKFYILHSYPFRWVWRKVIRSTLSKIKHLIIK